MTKQTTPNRRDTYQEITDRILESMESGKVVPWQRPWKLSPYSTGPRNPVSGGAYRGINVWLLLMTQWERNYDHSLWLTFKQAHEIAAKAARKAGHKVEAKVVGSGKTVYVYADGPNKGKSVGGIREGQNAANKCGGTTVVFWKHGTRVEATDEGETTRSWAMLRTYTVFNVAQCDDHVREYLCPPVTEVPDFSPIEKCEQICADWAEVPVEHGGDRAYYLPSEDRIQMPNREQFTTLEGYYTVRFHEMAHATGHSSRLARFKADEYREIHHYAEEELVAEFAACFLAGEAGIIRTMEKNSTAYMKQWAAKLREDNRLIVNAAQRAQKAADMILGRQGHQKTEETGEAVEAA